MPLTKIKSLGITDGTIVNADINASAAIDASKLTGLSSDVVLLATTTASSSSAVSFDGYFSSTYTNYQIHFYNLDFSTQTDLLVRFRIANADVTSSDYKYGTLSNPYFDVNGSGNGTQINNSWSSTHIKLNNNDLGTGVGDYVTQGILYLQNPLSASNYKMCMGDFAYMATALNIMKRESFVGSLQSATTALSGITFYPGAGNIVTGIFKLYGIK